MKRLPWKISPDLIPHKDFHKGYWLNINEPSPWYYFFSTDRTYKISNDPNFYDTLDEDLVKPVMLLHSMGIVTTPSCAGHFYSPDYYLKIYRRLEENAAKIVTKGIILENPETGTKYYYRNIDYKLPWDSRSFVNKVLNYQKIGVLGFIDSDKRLAKNIPSDFKVGHDKEITLVFEISDNPEEKSLKWNRLYEVLSNYLLL
jgi:hypothetical protein